MKNKYIKWHRKNMRVWARSYLSTKLAAHLALAINSQNQSIKS